jgi:hypothetical protein
MDAARDEHREHTVTLRDRTLDDVAVVRRSSGMTVMRPLNRSSFWTLCSRHTPTTS